jgi:hypothetical protein
MTVTGSDPTDEKTPGREAAGIWEGEPLALYREWGDRLLHGWIGHNVRLPGRHVHPAVRQAAERVRSAQAERDELAQELAARAGEKAQLAHRLAQESGRAAGPERVKAARQLTEFEAESNLIAALLPGAEQAVYAAWDALSAALGVYGAEWDTISLPAARRPRQRSRAPSRRCRRLWRNAS